MHDLAALLLPVFTQLLPGEAHRGTTRRCSCLRRVPLAIAGEEQRLMITTKVYTYLLLLGFGFGGGGTVVDFLF